MLNKTDLSVLYWSHYLLVRQACNLLQVPEEAPPPTTQQPLPRRKSPIYAQTQAQVRFIDELRSNRRSA